MAAGVLDLSDPGAEGPRHGGLSHRRRLGHGPATQLKLGALDIRYAGEVRDLDPKLARQLMTVVGERNWREVGHLTRQDLGLRHGGRSGEEKTRGEGDGGRP